MSPEQIKKMKDAAKIVAGYAVGLGIPSALLSQSPMDILVLSAVFGLPTCYLAGVFDPQVWGLSHGRTKEHT